MSESYSQATAKSANVLQGAPADTIGSHVGELDVHNKRLYELLQQLTAIGDRLLGPHSQRVEKATEPQAVSASLTMSLQRRAREQSMLIGTCVEQASRIESALGDHRG